VLGCAVNSRTYRTSGEKNCFCPCSSLCHPFPRHPSKTLLFFSSKKTNQVSKNKRKQKKFWIVRCGEGHQTCAVLVKGLQYNSSRNGDQLSLEKFDHRFTDETVYFVLTGNGYLCASTLVSPVGAVLSSHFLYF
jgi:hypothetical protein